MKTQASLEKTTNKYPIVSYWLINQMKLIDQ